MALVITIAGENRTSVIETDTIRINQVADSFTFTASLSLFDEDGDIDITAGSHLDADEITIVDGATTYFGGYVVNQDIDAAEEDSRHLHLQCQGYGIRLNETLVEYEEYSARDDWIIDDLFDTYLAAFDSATHVAQIDADLDISFTEMTLAECMDAICARTKGRWYIDNDKKVHYFAAESSGPGWFLSDTPEAAAENLITNPSLEVDTAGWAAWNGGGISRTAAFPSFGSYSLKITGDGAAAKGGMTDAITVVASTVYTVSVYASISLAQGNMRVWDDTNAGWIQVAVPITGAAITRYADTFTTPVGCVSVIIIFYDAAHWEGYFDGVQLELGAAVTSCCIGGRAGCDWSNGDHASTSDRIISYSYHDKPEKRIDAAAIVNRIRVIGADDFAVTRNDATSQAAYGIRAGIVTDQSLETTAAMEERGDDVLDKNKDPRVTYTVSTFQDGVVAGMDIGFRCPQLDIDTERVIRELNITWWMNEPSYELTLGTHAETSAISRAFYTGDTLRKIIVSPNVPLASRGWSCDLVFSATDHNTVAWAAGTITLAGGVGSFAIAPGADTGDMAATTYIFLDSDVSLTALQTDASAANAVGANKILVAVAKNVAAGKKAIFQVFGGEGTGVLVDTDSIAVGAVDTTEIAALAVEAAQIGALAVETGKLALLAVTNAQLGDDAVTADKILANTITAAEILGNTITAAEIAAGTITTAEILANTIVAGDIAANTITAGEIAANTITAGEILGNTITAAEIAAGTITTNEILANTILAGDIAANTITANEILANTITAAEIAAATITATEIVAATITADKLSIGQMIFSNADGLLILNPPIEIEKVGATNYWKTLRGQQATMAGALHLAAGRWAGTKALWVEVAATNLIDNPRMIDDDSDDVADNWSVTESVAGAISESVPAHPITNKGWLQQFSYTGVAGDVSRAIGYHIDTAAASFAEGDDVTISADVEGVLAGCTIRFVIQPKTAANVTIDTYGDTITLTGGLDRHTYTYTGLPANTDHLRVWVQVLGIDNGDELDVSFGAVNVEKTAFATTLIHGNAGDGYDWTNGDDDSTSTRAATEVNLDDHVGLVDENTTMSFRVVAQMPYDYDATWPSGATNFLFDLRDDATHRINMIYDSGNDVWQVFINGGGELLFEQVGFLAGDWIEFVLTLDFAADSYKLYIDGELADSDEVTAKTAPPISEWNLGSDFAAANQGGFVFAEYSVFDRVLTVGEAAQMFNLQRPLVDTGATDKPGIYILDGKFRIQSSQTGVRIEITADQIAGYDSAGTKQFYLQASDGKAYAGAGAVELSSGGIDIAVAAAAETTRAYKFNLSDVNIGGLYGLATAAGGWLRLYAIERAAKTSYIDIQALAPSTYMAQTFIRAKSGATDVQLVIKADSNAGTPGWALLTGADKFDFSGCDVNLTGGDLDITGKLDVSGIADFADRVYGDSFSTDDGTVRWEFGAHVGAIPGAVKGYLWLTINGTAYRIPECYAP